MLAGLWAIFVQFRPMLAASGRMWLDVDQMRPSPQVRSSNTNDCAKQDQNETYICISPRHQHHLNTWATQGMSEKDPRLAPPEDANVAHMRDKQTPQHPNLHCNTPALKAKHVHKKVLHKAVSGPRVNDPCCQEAKEHRESPKHAWRAAAARGPRPSTGNVGLTVRRPHPDVQKKLVVENRCAQRWAGTFATQPLYTTKRGHVVIERTGIQLR